MSHAMLSQRSSTSWRRSEIGRCLGSSRRTFMAEILVCAARSCNIRGIPFHIIEHCFPAPRSSPCGRIRSRRGARFDRDDSETPQPARTDRADAHSSVRRNANVLRTSNGRVLYVTCATCAPLSRRPRPEDHGKIRWSYDAITIEVGARHSGIGGGPPFLQHNGEIARIHVAVDRDVGGALVSRRPKLLRRARCL